MIRAIPVILALVACGERIVELAAEDATTPIDGDDSCVAGATQCTNCVDDDGDNMVDGFDIECSGAIDDDESSFATGVPGDNQGDVRQDCFYDGNGGTGDDGCDVHVCCLLAECPPGLPGPPFDPAVDCVIGDACRAACEPLTPPGCDCFGCCTICDDAGCEDIYVHPAFAPECDASSIHDGAVCPACVKRTECTSGCDAGSPSCETSADCPDVTPYCAAGCCLAVVE